MIDIHHLIPANGESFFIPLHSFSRKALTDSTSCAVSNTLWLPEPALPAGDTPKHQAMKTKLPLPEHLMHRSVLWSTTVSAHCFPVKPCSAHDRPYPGYQSYHLFTSNAGDHHKDHNDRLDRQLPAEPPSPRLSLPQVPAIQAPAGRSTDTGSETSAGIRQIVGCILVSHGK